MKQLITLLLMSMTFVGCNQANENALIKSEFHSGTVETQDPKSMAMNAFNDAYLANDMTGQEVIFTADALALVNGVEMTPAQVKGSRGSIRLCNVAIKGASFEKSRH